MFELNDALKEDMLQKLSSKGFWTSDQLVSKELVIQLCELSEHYFDLGYFELARIGKGSIKQSNTDIRRDQICWLERWQDEATTNYALILQSLMEIFKRELYLPLKRFESHFSLYPPEAFYKMHSDRHRLSPHRLLSCVLYIGHWTPSNGGELVIYQNNESHKIEPVQGRFVVFESSLLHEVKMTFAPRRSLTSWFRDDIL